MSKEKCKLRCQFFFFLSTRSRSGRLWMWSVKDSWTRKKAGWAHFKSIWKILNGNWRPTMLLRREARRLRDFKKWTTDRTTSKRGQPTALPQRENGRPRNFKERTADHVTSKRGGPRIEEPSELCFFEIKLMKITYVSFSGERGVNVFEYYCCSNKN